MGSRRTSSDLDSISMTKPPSDGFSPSAPLRCAATYSCRLRRREWLSFRERGEGSGVAPLVFGLASGPFARPVDLGAAAAPDA